jgi:hypothetical protein
MTITNYSVAQWLYDKIIKDKYVDQGSVVYEISKTFGDTFVYINENGNLAINKDILKEFKKLKNNMLTGKIEWDRSDRAWRYSK